MPAGLSAERMCILHFTLHIENECAEMRRETALGKANHERQVEFMKKIVGRGVTLVKVATSGFPMSDEIKARILSTLLTLMNCRENIDSFAIRQSPLKRFSRSNSISSGPYVPRIKRAGDRWVMGAFDDGTAVGKDSHLIVCNAKPKQEVVVSEPLRRSRKLSA
jgi:hypothetical protein